MKRLILLIVIMLSSLFTFAQNTKMGLIKVSGNKFVDESGNTIIFHGLNITDPDDLVKTGKWHKKHFAEIKAWGANIVRIPVHPAAWNSRGHEAYLELIDEAIGWCKELGLYMIMDWHSIGNLRTELYQNPMYNTTQKETFEFWLTISRKYQNEPTVAFYEIFNEPTTSYNQLGTCTWKQWKELVTDIVTIIYANNPKAIPLVAGFNWAYDLSPLKTDPIDIPGIAYVSHPYPQKRSQPWEAQWEQDWGFIAETHPLILTEIGFALPEEIGVHNPVQGDETYGNAIVNYAKSKGISWLVWVFDTVWTPMMVKDWNYTPTRQGAFFKKVLLENKN